jgi:hypothetical protein
VSLLAGQRGTSLTPTANSSRQASEAGPASLGEGCFWFNFSCLKSVDVGLLILLCTLALGKPGRRKETLRRQ